MATKIKKESPQLKIPAKLSFLVDSIANLTEDQQAITRVLEPDKVKLKNWLREQYFNHNADNIVITNTFDLIGRRRVLHVNFMNKYRLDTVKFDALQDLLGDQTDGFFKKGYGFFIIAPDNTSVLRRAAIKADLDKLAHKYGLVIQPAEAFSVADNFHDERHNVFSYATNLEIDKIIPVEIQVTI